MFLRSTVMDSHVRHIDEGVRWARSTALPLVQSIEGNLGLAMFVSRASGRVVLSSAWRTRAVMHTSEPLIADVRAEAARIFAAQPSVEEWEMAELHRRRRAERGFANRATRVELDPSDMDLLVDTYRTTTIPALDLLPGFCSAALLIDRAGGQGVSSVTWESREAMEASRPRAAEIRQVSVEKAHARPIEVVELEIAIDEIHVPAQGPDPTKPN
jgi:heme-degrading monooxygenase HmoA/quinol monooxygenase YgiN